MVMVVACLASAWHQCADVGWLDPVLSRNALLVRVNFGLAAALLTLLQRSADGCYKPRRCVFFKRSLQQLLLIAIEHLWACGLQPLVGQLPLHGMAFDGLFLGSPGPAIRSLGAVFLTSNLSKKHKNSKSHNLLTLFVVF